VPVGKDQLPSRLKAKVRFVFDRKTQRLLRALSDQTRLRIVALLEKDELSVNELQEITRLGQSRISTHLGLLADCELVRSRREGKRTFYKLNPQADTVASEFIQLAIRGAKELAETVDQLRRVTRIRETPRPSLTGPTLDLHESVA